MPEQIETTETTADKTTEVAAQPAEETTSVEEVTVEEDKTETPEETEETEVKEVDFKTEARKWEARSKANRNALNEAQDSIADLQAELEDLKGKAAQPAADTETSTALTQATVENAKLRAAIEHGLSLEDLEFINGTSPEAIASNAKKFAERFASAPRAALRTQGASTESAKPLTLEEQIKEQIREAEEAARRR